MHMIFSLFLQTVKMSIMAIVVTTILASITENGKKYYSVRLYSQSMKKNGGLGTIDNLIIAKDGSIYR